MRISDWSSDVCSSDLRVVLIGDPAPHDLTGIRLSVDFGRVLRHWGVVHGTHTRPRMRHAGPGAPHGAWPLVAANFGTRGCRGPAYPARKSVVLGKRGSVRVDSGGRRSTKKKKQ